MSSDSIVKVTKNKSFISKYELLTPIIITVGFFLSTSYLAFFQNLVWTETDGIYYLNFGRAILDDNGKHLSSKQIGEIFIKGDHVIDNYWNNSKADESINQGWIKTGDLGCFDSDKFLYLKSRKDDLLNVGGEKFTPEEIESVIKEISEIKDAAVIGIPNEIFGQIPIAFVVTKNELSSKQIINHCSKKLERYKIPQKIVVLEKIPKTDSGKIKRNILKSKFIQ